MRRAIFFTLAAFAGACSSGTTADQKGVVTPSTMSFAECQKSAEYEGGGRYAVEYDNGVCTVQR